MLCACRGIAVWTHPSPQQPGLSGVADSLIVSNFFYVFSKSFLLLFPFPKINIEGRVCGTFLQNGGKKWGTTQR